ncbi:MAG: undecaprenyl/decaprenyl-phosphate alpha-N-acetylglucosaminyl 1-phosphate transferase [Candidatus Blackburnbacteria bacterium]|nr:undecaprenyl/decaprenyl-phosphate alpha-N-acetylglucosaminyl 1-phosphate transferase [Candidatus Blackburnbacteria bacterium]
METFIKLFAPGAAISFLISLLCTPIIIKFAKRLKILDNPQKRQHPATLHTKPIPRGGGIPIFVAILVTSFLFLIPDQRLLGILGGGAILVAIGFLDDRRDINPYWRLLGQLVAALLVVASGIGIAFASNPLGTGILDLSHPRLQFNLGGESREIWLLSGGFAILWIVGLANAVSWSSGVDGQLSGFTAIAALFIAILSLRFSGDATQWPTTILAAITFGAFLGFLPWHIYPQKIMPGFGGATLAGFMLGVLSILATAKVGTLLLVLAIPIFDAGYTIIRRTISGKSPVWGDRGHLHHKLLDAGWSRQQIALFYWGATALLGVLALYLNATQKFYIIIGIALLLGAALIWLNSLSQLSKPRDPDSG